MDIEDKKSMIAEESEDNVVDPFKDFPRCSKVFLEKLKEVFDIRKLIRYSQTNDYLRGVQDVLDFIEQQNNK